MADKHAPRAILVILMAPIAGPMIYALVWAIIQSTR